MKDKIILLLGIAVWSLGSYMLFATHSVTTTTPGTDCMAEGAVVGGVIGAAAGAGAGALLGGIGIAACGTGVGIPVGAVCLGLAGVLGLGGAATGAAAGSIVSTDGTTTTIELPTYSHGLALAVIILGGLITIWALWQIIKARREKKKLLQIVD